MGVDRSVSSNRIVIEEVRPRTPGGYPAKAVVQAREHFSDGKVADDGCIAGGRAPEFGAGCDDALHRFGIVRCHDMAGEGEVGEVPPVGVEIGVRQVGRAGKCEAFSAGARRPGLGR